MRLDAIGVLFENSWQRLQKHFAVATQIFFAPLVLILISELLLARGTPSAFLLGAVIQFFATIVSILASIALISMFGKRTGIAASYRTGFKFFWAAVWMAILVSLAVAGGFVMLIIPGIMLAFQLAFANYALVLEGKHGIAALVQSREYLKDYWWAFVGRGLLLVFCLVAGILILFLPATLLFGYVAGQIVYAILLLIFAPFSVSYQYEIYENLRRLKPDAAEAAAKADRGFLKVSMVAGIVGMFIAAILLVAGLIFFPPTAGHWNAQYQGGYGYPSE